MTELLLWIIAVFAVVTAVICMRISGRIGEVRRRSDEIAENLALIAARLEKLETYIDEYWRGVEARVGKIHETFESGRACRMGGTVAEVDLKMGHLNRKMDELLERTPRPGQSTEAP